MSRYRLLAVLAAGIGLAASAVLVDSATLVGALRGAAAGSGASDHLLAGAGWFRLALSALGAWTAVLALIAMRSPTPSRQPLASRGHGRRPRALLVAGVLSIAAALRFHRLGDGLWYDEIFMRVRYVDLPWGHLITTFDSQNQHFLYTLLAKLAVSWFGDGAWSLRAPSALFGVASLWALYLVAAALVDRREALLAMALMTVSYHHVWFSQDARGYMGLLLWTLLGGWLLVRALEREDRRLWVAYAMVAALGMYTQLSMLFVVVGHFLVYTRVRLLDGRHDLGSRLVGLAFGFVPAGLGTLSLYALVLPEFFMETLHEGAGIAAWTNPLWAMAETLRSLRVGPMGFVVLAAACVGFGAGCLRLARRNPIVLELFFYPVALCLAVVLVQGHHLWPRLFFFACGYAAMIVVAGVYELVEFAARLLGRVSGRPVERAATAAACIAMTVALATALPRAYGPKQDFQGAIAYIEESAGPGDRALVAGLAGVPVVEFYGRPWQQATDAPELERIVEGSTSTWIVYTLPFELQSRYPDVMHVIESRFQIVRRFPGTLGGGEVVVCRSRPERRPARQGERTDT